MKVKVYGTSGYFSHTVIEALAVESLIIKDALMRYADLKSTSEIERKKTMSMLEDIRKHEYIDLADEQRGVE